MKKVRITVVKKVRHDDLIARYENPLENACDMVEGTIFVANGRQRPDGFCLSAWETLSPFVMALSHGAESELISNSKFHIAVSEVFDVKKVRITVVKKVRHDDLIARYENPLENACDMVEGTIFVANGWQRPDGFCLSAWETLSPFVMALSHGAENFYSGWMKNPKSALLSCNDGFRPVSFLLETLDEDVDN